MRLVILHGYGALPTSHWFTWLGDAIGGDVDIPALPDTEAPQRDAWVDAARAAMAGDDDLVVVGHSLGTVAALLALDGVDRSRIRGLVLVAPFWEPVRTLPELDRFLDLPAIPDLGDVPVVVIASDEDPIVPPELSERAAASLGVPVTTVASAGHFLDRDGWTTLPAARDAVLGMLARA
ncbi:RBBP9/YdeN family alpha/beta hydrolase [Agrococcus sp. SGAir0287]|uniref:RBBP9/YdeN family alpha/beta hydrolase n=1 Tax=Agrococcus sp. SGAir0287 TaxID=2070347 RepID=UPI0010CD20B6|nr:alpha/beta hydrolase [Agrococcus sp. SGAir0287]QCR20192.1 alpha/beta hydrolase [Agrococcus sp. SGAir0287]